MQYFVRIIEFLKHHLTKGDETAASWVNFYQARDIVNYRRMRGPLKDIRDLKLLEDFTEADFERLCHYLSYE